MLFRSHVFLAPPITTLSSESNVLTLMKDVFSSVNFKSFGLFCPRQLMQHINNLARYAPRARAITESALHLALSTYALCEGI